MNLVQAIIELFAPAPSAPRGPSPANLRAEAVVARRRANWPDPLSNTVSRQQRRAMLRRLSKEGRR